MLTLPYAAECSPRFSAMPVMVFLSVLIFAFSCHKAGPIEPPPAGLDTTSHVYTWTTTLLGNWAGSYLRDAAIINDTLAYAVGQIYLLDSLGRPETTPHNLVRWDGKNWHVERILVGVYGGSLGYNPLRTIYAFGPSDIWLFSEAGSWVHWDGNT